MTGAGPTSHKDEAERVLGLADPVTELHGVGPSRAAALARVGVRTLGDLIQLCPRRFERIGPSVEPGDLAEHAGTRVGCRGRVVGVRFVRTGRGRTAVRVQLSGRDGTTGEAVFFNQPWMREALTVGEEVAFYGPVGTGDRPSLQTPRRIDPDSDESRPGRLVPIYPAVDGLGPALVRDLTRTALGLVGGQLEDPLGSERCAALGVLDLEDALAELHEPTDADHFERARRRLALEPLLALQARLSQRRAARTAGEAFAIPESAEQRSEVLAHWPFTPTAGQVTVLDELERDLARTVPMRRLLQGDVGSGKTLLGVHACARMARAGHQSAFMAPTELLAEQHLAGQGPWLEALGLRAELLTGSLGTRERKALLRELAEGRIDLLFGTHALFSDDVQFASLGLCVIDEQHRFGVSQRRELLAKGLDTHVLLMTATPIPRSLALTLYGDLEVSTLRERPPGRGERSTHRLLPSKIPRLMSFIDERLARGERAYWVCPRIDDSELGRGVESARDWLLRSKLARHGVELVHGRIDPEERARRVARFRSGESGLLVGTTVIEVGVDVPEATVMVIEGVERLGLAQLHQLRGRVGRGAVASHCFLHGKSSARERIELLSDCDDGFALAEHDLSRRGMGDLVGARQAGANAEGLGDEPLDIELLVQARDLIAREPGLCEHYLARADRIARD